MNNSNTPENQLLSETDPRFAAGNRAIVFDVARDCWAFVNKSRISTGNDARIIGTIVSLVTTVVGIVGSTISFASSVADQNSSLPQALQVNLRLQNLTSSIITIQAIGHSNARVMGSPVIMTGETVEYPIIFNGPRTGQLLVHLNLSDENGMREYCGLVIIPNPTDVRVRSVFMRQGLGQTQVHGPNNVDPRENRPMIYRNDRINIYCTSVIGTETNQVANIDVAIVER